MRKYNPKGNRPRRKETVAERKARRAGIEQEQRRLVNEARREYEKAVAEAKKAEKAAQRAAARKAKLEAVKVVEEPTEAPTNVE